MTDPELSAIVALVAGLGLAIVLVVPYIAWSYRRRGEFGLGHAVLAVGMLVYAMALWTYTVLPVPEQTAQWCADHAVTHPQLRPLQFLDDVRDNQRGGELGDYLHNRALQQAAFNVALFVPFGMFGRHMFRRGPLSVILAGATVSLLIECTQLTGNWFLFQCPYRLFDVDDILTNTTGAALGFLLAPVLRLIPGQKVTAPPGAARPVTTARRLLGMGVDLLAVWLLGGALHTGLSTYLYVVHHTVLADQTWAAIAAAGLGLWLPAVLLLLVVALAGNGASLGQRIVLLRPITGTGQAPSASRTTARFLAGSGGFFLLSGLSILDVPLTSLLATLLLLISGIMAARPRDHRGLSGLLTGMYIVDARLTDPHRVAQRRV